VVYRLANLDLKSLLPKPDKIDEAFLRSQRAQSIFLTETPDNAARMPAWRVSRSLRRWFKTEAFKQLGGKYGAEGGLRKVQGIAC
jgi:hypothetical protein